jgi:hypothetical protein
MFFRFSHLVVAASALFANIFVDADDICLSSFLFLPMYSRSSIYIPTEINCNKTDTSTTWPGFFPGAIIAP